MESSRTVILGENNWPAWKLQTSIILKARKLYKVVSEKQSSKDPAVVEKWDDLDRRAQEIIVLRVDEGVLTYLATCDTAYEMWEKLNTVYDSKSKVGVHLIHQKFYNLKYEGPMAKYLSTVDEIVNKLKSMKEEISEKMVITKILMSLPESYKHFVSAWESVTASEQTLANLQTRLLVKEERNGVSEAEAASTSAALLSKHDQARGAIKKHSDKSESASVKCFECGKIGHFKRDCRSRKCNYCGKIGHVFKDCRARQQQNHKALNAYIMEGECAYDWVLDTGASDHMCHDRECFTEFKEVGVGDAI